MAAAAPRPTYAPSTSAAGPPAGTFAPGTKVQVGSHRVVVERYLSEGGFAHVYVVRLPAPDNAQAVLKRVAVPDKDALSSMRTEVETMKKLKGHAHIVSYIDSHASQLKGGGYEVFLLMEYCQGGGLIDFMNTRLKNRLTEPEILEILQHAAEGIACMHYLRPPLLHRDLKIENILISTSPSRIYKLCDFGSTAPPRPAATNAAEGKLIEEDVQKNTTLQYRSPEMIDVYRKRPIDEKSDIWALGVFLYKLCYYTTPFEEQGQMAILTASFKYPAYPAFSDRVKRLIALMLMEDPSRRPNIYQVLKEVCTMRGKEVPVKDIYSSRTRSEARSMQELPPREPNVKSPPMVGATVTAPDQPKQFMPEVTPMRRGRPTAPTQQQQSKPDQSPGKPAAGGDPFAALDSKNYEERVKAVNELSGKFPSLDEFSLLQDKSAKFQFNTQKPPPAPAKSQQLTQRVTNALADQAFAKPSSPAVEPPVVNVQRDAVEAPRPKPAGTSSAEPPQKPPKPSMVSVGTMTSPRESPIERQAPASELKPRPAEKPIWRVPQQEEPSPRLGAIDRFDSLSNKRHSQLREYSRSPNPEIGHTSSSRPSLEGRRPLSMDISGDINRSRSANDRQPPSRTGTPPVAEQPSKRESFFRRHSHRHSKHLSPEAADLALANEANIESDVDYLRVAEEESARSSHTRSGSLHKSKHGSLGHFAGKVGDTLRRFEGSRSSSSKHQRPESVSLIDADADYVSQVAVGNAANDAAVVDDDDRIDVTEDLSPEMRRELERRQLEQEERRVEEAAQAYRQRVAANGAGGASRASAIQNRVKDLLDESGRTSPVKRTAEGYGRYTTATETENPSAAPTEPLRSQATDSLPLRSGRPTPHATSPDLPPAAPLPQRSSSIAVGSLARGKTAAPLSTANKPLPARPSAPPKPVALRTGTGAGTIGPAGRTPTLRQEESAPAAPDSPDWQESFDRRYPRLSLELVDADLGEPNRGHGAGNDLGRKSTGGRPLRVRDV